MDAAAHRIYAREYGRARRAGFTAEEARASGRAAINDPIKATPLRERALKYHTAEERQAARQASRLKTYAKEKQELHAAAVGREAAGMTDFAPRARPSPAALREAARIRNMWHPTIVGQLMGDPMPGRSALDKRR